jgi:hypothetical protein
MKQYKNSQSGFAHLGIFLILIVVVGVVGFAGWQVKKNQDNKSQSSEQSIGDARLKDCKGNGMVKMTHMPMDIEDVQTVVPIGALAGAHVTPIDHLYFYPKDMQNRDAAPVYAMADGTIISYQERTQNVDTGSAKKGEYRIEIQHNCDIVSYFDLLTSLDESVKSKLKQGSGQNIPVRAGQVIGRVGAQSLDTAIYNYGMTLKGFVKPDSYKAEPWKIHTDDFFKYFDDSIKEQMLAKNVRKSEPRSGKIDYDIEGKLIGNWFEVGTNGYAGPKEYQNGRNPGGGRGYWSGHFSITPDVIEPTVTNLSFGDYQGQAKQFSAKDGSDDPAAVDKAAGIVKYELVQFNYPSGSPTGGVMVRSQSVQGVALLEVLDNNQIKMEVFPGKTAAQIGAFTSAAKTYER